MDVIKYIHISGSLDDILFFFTSQIWRKGYLEPDVISLNDFAGKILALTGNKVKITHKPLPH